jgi:hypothetical protein
MEMGLPILEQNIYTINRLGNRELSYEIANGKVYIYLNYRSKLDVVERSLCSGKLKECIDFTNGIISTFHFLLD